VICLQLEFWVLDNFLGSYCDKKSWILFVGLLMHFYLNKKDEFWVIDIFFFHLN
jgi:hypothetical protein